MIKLAGTDAQGLYHLGGPQPFSRYDLLSLLIAEIRKVAPEIAPALEPCGLHELPFLEKRPLCTALAIDKLQAKIAWRFTPMAEICRAAAVEQFGGRRPA
jgi:dTDP-4-dehydrorhamnose reductase